VDDLWKHTTATTRGSIDTVVPPDSVVLYRVAPVQ